MSIYEFASKLCIATVILHSKITVLFPVRPHQVDRVPAAAHINANE